MQTFRILAQSYTTTQRIQRTLRASNADAAHRMVAAELDAAGFYVVQIDRA